MISAAITLIQLRCVPRQRPPSGSERQALHVISEEAGYLQTRRRKQLIPRARLVHHERAEEPTRRRASGRTKPGTLPKRSPSVQFRVTARARPLLLTPPPDFRSDDCTAAHTVGAREFRRRAPPGYVTGNAKIFHDILKAEYTETKTAAAFNREVATARRKGSSHRNITSGSINDYRSYDTNTVHCPAAHISAFSTSDGPSANSAENSHKAAAESTEHTLWTVVQQTRNSVPDFGKEVTQRPGLCADEELSTETRIGKSAATPKNNTPEDTERNAHVISNSARRGDGESANKLKFPKTDLSTSDTDCTCVSANETTGTNKEIKERTVQSVAIVQRYSRDYTKTRPNSGHPEKDNKSPADNETRQNNVDGQLSVKSRAVHESAGPHFSGTGFCKGQRGDGHEERITENFVFKTSNQREDRTYEKDREIDSENGIERKILFTVSDEDRIFDKANVILSEGCRTKKNQNTVKEKGTRVQEYSGNKCRKAHSHADVRDGKDKYSAGEKRKRAHSSGDKIKQAEISACDRKGMKHSSSGKVKKTVGILSGKYKTNGVTENKNRIKYSAEGKNDKRESCAQEIESSATVKEQNTGGTNDCEGSKPEKNIGLGGDNNTSWRTQVPKIKDSTTIASRHDEMWQTSSGERPQECQTERPPAASEESGITTRTLRGIFEGGTDKASCRTEIPTENMLTATSEEDADRPKPMLFATLSVENHRNASQKLNSRTKINSSPDENSDPQTSLPSGKTPAFIRASICGGQRTQFNVTRSVPGDPKPPQHKSNKTDTSDRGSHTERDSKVAAFDGLMQYLQDHKHGLREMLVNSNVVIIEPVRQSTAKQEDWKSSTRKSTSESTCRITGATVKNSSTGVSNTLPRQQKSQQPILRRHFFYHPIRTNRSLVDEELPDPDKVRYAREMFERTMKIKDPCEEEINNVNDTAHMKNRNRNSAPLTNGVPKSENKNANKVKRKYLTVDTVFRHNVWNKRWTDSGSLSSGISSDLSCYETDVDSHDTFVRKEEPTGILSSDDNEYHDQSCSLDDSDEGHYVTPEVMDRIRACGTTVTYYGGQVIAASNGPVRSPMTLAIMDEIQRSKNTSKHGNRIMPDECVGVKFRLVKSNSCGSRLELAGTERDDKWNGTEQHRHEKREACKTEEIANAEKCQEEVKASATTQYADKHKEKAQPETAQSWTSGCLDSMSPRLNEDRPVCGQAHTHYTYIRRGPPHKAKVFETGNIVPFDEMEFEEYEIAEDSLNVTEGNIECNKSNVDKVGQKQQRDCHPALTDINITAAAMEEQSDELENIASRETKDVQMITWASRSVRYD